MPQPTSFGARPMAVDYDRLAAHFDERYRHLTYPGILAKLRGLIDRPGLDALEVGCGTGHWLDALSDLGTKLVGVDPSSAMLGRARTNARGASLVCARAEQLPFSCNSVDLIFCVNAFHHFSDPKKFLCDAKCLLRKTGRLAIFGLDPHVPEMNWYLYDYFPGLREIDLQRFVPHGQIARAGLEAGFQDVVTTPVERIQTTYYGQEVLSDPFLDRASTSQLQLISDEAYTLGKRAIISRLEGGNETKVDVRFVIDLTLCATIAKCSPSAA